MLDYKGAELSKTGRSPPNKDRGPDDDDKENVAYLKAYLGVRD